jgi:hypothetical protein
VLWSKLTLCQTLQHLNFFTLIEQHFKEGMEPRVSEFFWSVVVTFCTNMSLFSDDHSLANLKVSACKGLRLEILEVY